ncbi:hypothetical protein [Streptomyces lavendofoliae]|uniref:hypothetical protein n=1 Tax=Streptomyces lavendofoliae TaxID=67314 RepID=UPI00300EF804
MAVNETVIAMLRPKPSMATVDPPHVQAAVDGPDGIGTIASYWTEVAARHRHLKRARQGRRPCRHRPDRPAGNRRTVGGGTGDGLGHSEGLRPAPVRRLQGPRPTLGVDCDLRHEIDCEQVWPGAIRRDQEQDQTVPEQKTGGAWLSRFRR